MKINDLIEVEIIDDNHNGNGIAKISSNTLFVPRTLKGDIVLGKITKIKGNYIFLEPVSFIKKSNMHQKQICPYYESCGGCSLLHTTYEKENELKKKYINRLFKHDASITFFDRYNYRNKVTLHVENGKIGYYKKNSNELIEINKCLLLDNEINNIISTLKEMNLSKISSIVIKKCSKGLLISFTGTISKLEALTSLDIIESIYVNNELVYGNEYCEKDFNGFLFNINGNSFFQVNDKCAIALYDKIKEYVENSEKLLDLYCGTSSIGIYLKDICKSIVGVEINEDSVKCARLNIKNNNVKNYEVILGDASLIKEEFDTIVVDPPRAGLSKKVISNLQKMQSNKIIYVSCNPSTLKRDIELLTDYKLKEISCFNMFSGTNHVECVTMLQRKSLEK